MTKKQQPTPVHLRPSLTDSVVAVRGRAGAEGRAPADGDVAARGRRR
jgi:hypothetical protein